MPELLSRTAFDERARERDSDTCLVPWCEQPVDEVHHIIERGCWEDGGYYLRNAASVCNPHHRAAEQNYIPPQAFWYWIAVDPLVPDSFDREWQVNKWGDTFPDRPFTFSPPTLPNSATIDGTEHLSTVDHFVGQPLAMIGIPTGTYRIVGVDEILEQDAIAAPASDSYRNTADALRVIGDAGSDTFVPLAAYDTEYNLWLSTVTCEAVVERDIPVIRTYDGLDNETEVYRLHDRMTEAIEAEEYAAVLLRVTYPVHNAQFSRRFACYCQS